MTDEPQEATRKEFLGLDADLWRLAVVTGIAQFSMSIWTWRFSIFMESNIPEGLQMGLTYTAGTLAALIGFYSSGIISDFIGRKRTMIVAFVPMSLGLFLLYSIHSWPWVPISYACVNLGWSFILIVTRAVPADAIAKQGGNNPARKFMMVLMPAFLVDGLSPLIAGSVISSGFGPETLMLIGAGGSLIAMVCTAVVVRESLGADTRKNARSGSKIILRGLSPNFWKMVAGMMPFYFAFSLAVNYLGNLCVGEWGVSDVVYGQTWSSFSLTSSLLMYFASRIVDHNRKGALVFMAVGNSIIYMLFAVGTGVYMMFALNIAWAIPIVMWGGSERSLIVQGASKERQGRALGTYTFLMSSTGLVAPLAGKYIWDLTGSLRVLYATAGALALIASVFLALVLRTVKEYRSQSGSQAVTVEEDFT